MAEEVKKTQPVEAPQEDFKEFINQLLTLLPPKAREVVSKYSREILAGALAVVLGLILVSGYTHYRESQEKSAATLLGTALYEKAPEKRVTTLKQVVKEHGSTDAARLAQCLLARALFEKGDMDGAAKHFEEASKRSGKHSVLRQTALLGLGAILEEKGQFDEAIKRFDEAIKVSRGLERIARMDMARVAKIAGRREVALEAFNTLLSENPSAQDLDFVKFEILELKRAEKSGS